MKYIYTVFRFAPVKGQLLGPIGSFDNEADAMAVSKALGHDGIDSLKYRVCKTKMMPSIAAALKEVARQDKARKKRMERLD
jgi:hypothetical protein